MTINIVEIAVDWSVKIDFVHAAGVYTANYAPTFPDVGVNPVVCIVFCPVDLLVAGQPSAISLGGVSGSVGASFSAGGTANQVVAMIPLRNGLPVNGSLVLDYPQAYAENKAFNARAFVAINVSPDSDDFGSGFWAGFDDTVHLNLPPKAMAVTADFNLDASGFNHPSAAVDFVETVSMFAGDLSSRGAYSVPVDTDFEPLIITWTPAPFTVNVPVGFVLEPIADAPPPPPEEPTVIVQLMDDEFIPQLLLSSRLHLREIVCAPEIGSQTKPCHPQDTKPDCCDKVSP
jgi:hypothetical protein